MFIKASQEWLEQFEDVKFEGLQGAGARKTLLVVGIMAAHGLGEGCGVGVSFCGARGWAQASPIMKFESSTEQPAKRVPSTGKLYAGAPGPSHC